VLGSAAARSRGSHARSATTLCAYLIAGMVFVARGAFNTAEELPIKGAELQSLQMNGHHKARVDGRPAFGLHWLLGLCNSAKATSSLPSNPSSASARARGVRPSTRGSID
jgi:hypothetical protein